MVMERNGVERRGKVYENHLEKVRQFNGRSHSKEKCTFRNRKLL